MRKIELSIAVIGALLGVTGAYATKRHAGSKFDVAVYNWYLNGQIAFTATIQVAKSACPTGLRTICLRGTATKYMVPPVTLWRP
ncbi:hypothetical protein ACTJJB_25465 [Chitinophaga sp. 22536]|uniref:hypothetical protein n=1 Tax=unclassified Chitinophaga TaxID=2619133 RepID=UPI003F836CBB